jgi:hypothetical protein
MDLPGYQRSKVREVGRNGQRLAKLLTARCQQASDIIPGTKFEETT